MNTQIVIIATLLVASVRCLSEREYQNEFTNWMQSFKKYYAAGDFQGRYTSNNVNVLSSSDVKAPSSFDWRDHGAVTGVKNQGQCMFFSLSLFFSFVSYYYVIIIFIFVFILLYL